VGCGLCGIESLEQALRDLPPVGTRLTLGVSEAAGAVEALCAHQPLHDLTHAVHAAGFLLPGRGIVAAREDVGRHNALDKLIGALLAAGIDPATGAIVLTSRVSVEMVQKTVLAGAGVLIAASAPTAQALRLAEGAGLTVAAFARGARLEVFTHPQRLQGGASDVA
jgi:FdhD protein